MNKDAHLAIGFTLGIAFILAMNRYLGWFDITSSKAWITYLIIMFVYSLLADCDLKNSQIVWTFIAVSIMALSVAFYLNNNILMMSGIGLLSVTYIFAEFFPHRGPTHTIWFVILTSVPIYFLLGLHESVLSGLVYYSHLFADGEYFKFRF